MAALHVKAPAPGGRWLSAPWGGGGQPGEGGGPGGLLVTHSPTHPPSLPPAASLSFSFLQKYASEGARVLAMGYRQLDSLMTPSELRHLPRDAAESQLTFAGGPGGRGDAGGPLRGGMGLRSRQAQPQGGRCDAFHPTPLPRLPARRCLFRSTLKEGTRSFPHPSPQALRCSAAP